VSITSCFLGGLRSDPNRPQQYQQDLFNELRAEDELVILARGLGLLRLVTNLLHSYDAAGNNLVLVVGADERENEWIGEGMPCEVDIVRNEIANMLGSSGRALCYQQIALGTRAEGNKH
jgi:hypothetical protein